MYDGVGYSIPSDQTKSIQIDLIQYRWENIHYIQMYGLHAVHILPSL